jgi:hypothetical protein
MTAATRFAPARATAIGLGLALAALLALAGCGKGSPSSSESTSAAVQARGVETIVVHVGDAGTAATATRNTTRLGGAGPVQDAASIARTAYPGLTSATRPQAVVLVDADDWPAALASSSLASSPLGAPLLYSEGAHLPPATVHALAAMRPTGASSLGDTQLLLLDPAIAAPSGYRTREATVAAAEPDALAASVAKLLTIAHGQTPHAAIVVNPSGPQALAMPAAGLAAQSGAPILFVSRTGVPAATASELRSLGHPAIYTVGSTAIGTHTLTELARYGPVTRVEAAAGEDATPAGNAVAVSRFSSGSFGWGIREAGHGLVFANATRPLDAPAAAILSATGDYAPLLLLENSHSVPAALASYLSDIQPAAPHSQPVHGVYNHGWLIGDTDAISAVVAAELDAMLQIVPTSTPSSESSSLPIE